MYIYIYVVVCICICMCIYIYIYIYNRPQRAVLSPLGGELPVGLRHLRRGVGMMIMVMRTHKTSNSTYMALVIIVLIRTSTSSVSAARHVPSRREHFRPSSVRMHLSLLHTPFCFGDVFFLPQDILHARRDGGRSRGDRCQGRVPSGMGASLTTRRARARTCLASLRTLVASRSTSSPSSIRLAAVSAGNAAVMAASVACAQKCWSSTFSRSSESRGPCLVQHVLYHKSSQHVAVP